MGAAGRELRERRARSVHRAEVEDLDSTTASTRSTPRGPAAGIAPEHVGKALRPLRAELGPRCPQREAHDGRGRPAHGRRRASRRATRRSRAGRPGSLGPSSRARRGAPVNMTRERCRGARRDAPPTRLLTPTNRERRTSTMAQTTKPTSGTRRPARLRRQARQPHRRRRHRPAGRGPARARGRLPPIETRSGGGAPSGSRRPPSASRSMPPPSVRPWLAGLPSGVLVGACALPLVGFVVWAMVLVLLSRFVGVSRRVGGASRRAPRHRSRNCVCQGRRSCPARWARASGRPACARPAGCSSRCSPSPARAARP